MEDAVAKARAELDAVVEAGLARARDGAGLAALLSDVERVVSRARAAGRDAAAPPPACGPGCAGCCVVNVATVGVEGAAAAEYLRSLLGAAERDDLAARLTRFHAHVRWMDDGERIRRRWSCPFLDEERRCAIHPARPLACRAVSSLDPHDCGRALAERAEEDGGGGLVRMDLLQKALYDTASDALADGLARRGLDARPRDVSGMTAVFLTGAVRASEFLAGARLPIP